MAYLSDLHCHPSFKPYYKSTYSDEKYTMWEEIPFDENSLNGIAKTIKKMMSSTEKDSQSDLNQLVQNNFKSVFLAIHPIEYGWFNINEKKLIMKIADLLWNLSGDINQIATGLTSVPIKKIKQIREHLKTGIPVDYYLNDTFKEYQFIVHQQSIPGAGNEGFKIATDYDHYKSITETTNNIAGIITLEGGHCLSYLPYASSFCKEYHEHSEDIQQQIREEVLKNVNRIKGIGDHAFAPEHTPLFLTLVHYYNNFLAGHARSYSGLMGSIFNQTVGLNTGITALGREVIEKLLHKSETERRVLIDAKHMSLATRKEFYGIVRQKRLDGDNIPIIFSHGAVNGYNMNYFNGDDHKIDHTNGYFCHWSINLYNEDIREIVESKGLIGLDPHEGRMPGGKAKDELDKLSRKIRRNDHNLEKYLLMQKDAYVKIFMGNILQIIDVVDDVSAWDHICIGSDYDGIMDPFDRYEESADLNLLIGDIQYFLKYPFPVTIYRNNTPYELSVNEIKRLMFGLTPKEIMEKLAYKNIDLFLSKYFTDDYRMNKSGGAIS